MLPIEHTRGEALLALARTHFDAVLRPIEEQVIRHSCAYEDPADYIPAAATILPAQTTADLAPQAEHATLEPDRTPTGRPLPHWQGPELRPALLRWLLTDPEATALLEPRGLRVWNARLTETLDLTGCRIPAPLELRYCLLDAPILLASAELPTLRLRNSTLQHTLDAPFLKLHGPLYLDDITAAAALNFNGARIDGEVHFWNTALTARATALSMQGATIANDLEFVPSFLALGALYMKGIRVGGFIDLSGATLTAPSVALRLDNATVGGAVYLTEAFQCDGTIHMMDAKIDGQLNCTGATLTTLEDALSLDGARIGGSIVIAGGFGSTGAVRMPGAQIGGQVICDEASIQLLYGRGVTVAREFFWTGIRNAATATLQLQDASLMSLHDDLESWPAKGNLFVDGLVAGELRRLAPCTPAERAQNQRGRPLPLLAKDRIAWLNRQPDSQLSEPQPWMHLARLLENRGKKRPAKRALFELRMHQSRAGWRSSRFGSSGYLWDTTFARLEEQPLRILLPILLFALLGGTTFHRYRAHFAETSDAAYRATHTPNHEAAPRTASAYPKFQPFVYALENILPVVKLGQDDHWAPDPTHTSPSLYRGLAWFRWLLILSGYVMGGILAAAVTARFRT